MNIDFKKLVEPYKDIALSSLVKNIQINSVYDETTISKDAPYGQGVKNCFDYLKEIALNDGFNVDTCDGRCLEISYGTGKNLIYIFAHQDVVPINGNWDDDPFSGIIKDNRVYGRGTSDDKGPGISAYYALKALKDNNLIDDYRVRLVFGGDEERGSSCLEYYFNVLKKEDPTYGFTPDGDFPLIYGEKGICNYEYKFNYESKNIISIEAGTASNAVIDVDKVKVNNPEILIEYLKNHDEIEYNQLDLNTFEFIGIPAHGSVPNEGKNSGLVMLKSISEAYGEAIFVEFYRFYHDLFGKELGIYFDSDDMGVTTLNVGLISYLNNEFSLTVNFRFPSEVNPTIAIESIRNKLKYPLNVLSISEPLYFNPKTTPFILKLMEVYKSETGSDEKPMAIGGGTYAKEAKNTVAFGSHFANKEDNIHASNEHIDLEDFYNSMPIYAHAIYALGKMKNEN